MAGKPPLPGPTLAERREQTIQLLQHSFASDRLSVEEFEARLDRAYRAADAGALDSLVADLPAPAAAGTPAVRRPPAPPPEAIRERQFMIAVMGGHERKGPWIPARRTMVLAFMGGAVLDFREASLPAGVTEIDIFTMMGGVDIIVPPGVAVDSSGFAIMGAFEHGPGRPVETPPDAPVIRIGGLALMGAVEIHTRLPGESARDAKRRLRETRKQQLRSGRRDPLP